MGRKSDKHFHFRNFLRETTLHGVRYVLDGRTFAEKASWILIISLSFSYAGYLIMTSIQETEDNPITSTVEVVDGKTIKFPAVTIVTKPVTASAYRFIATIYDSFEFDCSHNLTTSLDCMEKTKKLRDDFQPLIRNFVTKIIDHWEFLWYNNVNRHFKNPKSAWFKSVISQWMDSELFLNEICIISLDYHVVKFEREEFLTILAENFQAPLSDLTTAVQSYLHRVTEYVKSDEFMRMVRPFDEHPYLGPFGEPLGSGLSLFDCNELSTSDKNRLGVLLTSRYSIWIDTILMLWNLAQESKDVISLGDLLLFAHDQQSSNQLETTDRVYPNNMENASSSLPDKLLTVLTNTKSQLTVDEIVRFVGNSRTGVRSVNSNFDGNLVTNSNCTNTTITNGSPINDCYIETFHSNLSHALRVLKYLVQPAHARIHPGQTQEDFKMAIELVKNKYSLKCNFSKGNCHNYDPVFRHCRFGHVTQDNKEGILKGEHCTFFRRTFGIKGISYEFNPSMDFFKIYSDKNAYNKMFFEEIHSQDIVSEGKQAVLSNKNTLDFFIYPDSLEKYILSGSELTSPQLAIHHSSRIPIDFMKLQRGYRYLITVTPTMITTDEDLIDIPESKRGCRFESEHKQRSIFSHYSHNGCLFECQLKKAFSGPNASNCLPWDSPHVETPISVCHRENFHYYESSPYDIQSTDDCDCPVDCDVYGYTFTWSRQPMTGLCNELSKSPWQTPFLLLHKSGEWDYQYETEEDCGQKYDKLLTRNEHADTDGDFDVDWTKCHHHNLLPEEKIAGHEK